MRVKMLSAIVTAASLQASCAIPVTDSEIDWRFPPLSMDGCPDLTGSYYEGAPVKVADDCLHSRCSDKLYPIGLYALLTGGTARPIVPGTTFQSLKPLPNQTVENRDRTVYISEIKYDANTLRLALKDISGATYIVGAVPLNHSRVGCRDGSLIIRDLAHVGGAEGSRGYITWYETEIKVVPNGLIAHRWSETRPRSRLSGQAYGNSQDVSSRAWTFAPAISKR
jgi:hypothetical protein